MDAAIRAARGCIGDTEAGDILLGVARLFKRCEELEAAGDRFLGGDGDDFERCSSGVDGPKPPGVPFWCQFHEGHVGWHRSGGVHWPGEGVNGDVKLEVCKAERPDDGTSLRGSCRLAQGHRGSHRDHEGEPWTGDDRRYVRGA